MNVAPPSPEPADDILQDVEHPRGTLAIVIIFGVLFALGWFAMYFFGSSARRHHYRWKATMHVELYERIWMWAAGGADRAVPRRDLVTPAPGRRSRRATSRRSIRRRSTRIRSSAHRRHDATRRQRRRAGRGRMFSFAPDPIEVPAQRAGDVPAHQRRRHPRLPGRRHQRQRDGDPGLRQPVHA